MTLSSSFVASETLVGMAYGPSGANLFKVTGNKVVEYLAVAEEERSASKLIPPVRFPSTFNFNAPDCDFSGKLNSGRGTRSI